VSMKEEGVHVAVRGGGWMLKRVGVAKRAFAAQLSRVESGNLAAVTSLAASERLSFPRH